MARITKTNGTTKVSESIIAFIKANRNDLSTCCGWGGNEVSVSGKVLSGGHFKLRSAMLQAGLSAVEIEKALA